MKVEDIPKGYRYGHGWSKVLKELAVGAAITFKELSRGQIQNCYCAITALKNQGFDYTGRRVDGAFVVKRLK